MIFALFINVVFAFVYAITAVFRLLPDVSLPSGLTSSIANASGYASAIDAFFPVHELVAVLIGVFLVYEAAYFAYKLIMWVIKKIPTIN